MLKTISLLLGSALAAQAQQVTLVTPSSMQFTDPAYGVTFRYPAKWNFSAGNEFYSPVSITSSDSPPRGVVFFKDDGGYNSYPKTNLNGAEFVCVNRKTASAKECSALALQGEGNAKPLAAKTINNIDYTHAKAENAGMCHQVQEDVYAAYRNQSCYLFDLAIHTICAGVKDNTRGITNTELAQVEASLEKILTSVEISDAKKD
jgi:hypothetical protein